MRRRAISFLHSAGEANTRRSISVFLRPGRSDFPAFRLPVTKAILHGGAFLLLAACRRKITGGMRIHIAGGISAFS